MLEYLFVLCTVFTENGMKQEVGRVIRDGGYVCIDNLCSTSLIVEFKDKTMLVIENNCSYIKKDIK